MMTACTQSEKSRPFFLAMRVPVRYFFFLSPLLVAWVVSLLLSIDLAFVVFASGSLYDSAEALPHHKVALVFGTSKYLGNGQPSPFYEARIQAAQQLLASGKVEYLLLSGDNQYESYNEPIRMKESLLANGVAPDRIVLDYAGFSTLDSVIRARKVFGQIELTVVSQNFQNERAVFIGAFSGVRIHGFNAREVGGQQGLFMMIREIFARAKAFLDIFFFETDPHFLGPKVVIP